MEGAGKICLLVRSVPAAWDRPASSRHDHDHAQSQAHSGIGYCDVVRCKLRECACMCPVQRLLGGDSRMLPKKKTKASFGLGRLQVL